MWIFHCFLVQSSAIYQLFSFAGRQWKDNNGNRQRTKCIGMKMQKWKKKKKIMFTCLNKSQEPLIYVLNYLATRRFAVRTMAQNAINEKQWNGRFERIVNTEFQQQMESDAHPRTFRAEKSCKQILFTRPRRTGNDCKKCTAIALELWKCVTLWCVSFIIFKFVNECRTRFKFMSVELIVQGRRTDAFNRICDVCNALN